MKEEKLMLKKIGVVLDALAFGYVGIVTVAVAIYDIVRLFNKEV
jgi:hypothetical protein